MGEVDEVVDKVLELSNLTAETYVREKSALHRFSTEYPEFFERAEAGGRIP